jgi:hypothetical protein
VVGGLVGIWLVVSALVWIFTWDGSNVDPQQPGVTNTTLPQPEGVTTPQQPGGNAITVDGQTLTIPAQK